MVEEKRKEQQFRIDIDANEIALVKENEFEGTVTATLTRGNRATANQQVQLYLAGVPLGNPLETDENGKVVKDFTITTTAKSISVEAQTVGFATRAKKFITLPRLEEKKKDKRSHKFIVRAEGKDGNYKLIISVFAEDGTPLEGIPVIIDDREQILTGANGIVQPYPEIKFLDEGWTVNVQAGELTEKLTLLGPEKRRKPPEIPKWTDEDRQGGLIQMFRRAWQKGTQELQRKEEKK